MHWLRQLAELYCEKDLPLFHDELMTDIEVTLSYDGRLIKAEHKRLKTIIPVTEKSAVRTSALQPHPLCDRLDYVAGDIGHYIGKNNRFTAANSLYLKQLNKWADSVYSTEELLTVCRYLNNKALFCDLLKTGALDGFSDNDAAKAAVRFTVGEIRLYQDSSIRSSHILHTRSLFNENSLCCLTGELTQTAILHLKRITSPKSMAKLISQGQLPISREASFKAHAVLRRLIDEQSIKLGRLTIISWNTHNTTVALALWEVNKGNLSVAFYGEISAYQQKLLSACSTPQQAIKLLCAANPTGALNGTT